MKSKLLLASMAVVLLFVGIGSSQTGNLTTNCLPVNSKIYIAQMPGDFHKFMTSALKDVHAQLLIVTERDKADFEMKDAAEESKPEGPGSPIFVNHSGSDESIRLTVANIKTSNIVFSAMAFFPIPPDRDIAKRAKRDVANRMARAIRDKLKKDEKSGCMP